MPTPAAVNEVDIQNGPTYVRIPSGVVYRSFPTETVVLHLETGTYHGLNPTGGRMLELLERLGSIEAVAQAVAEEYERPVDEVLRDVRSLCAALAERRLIEVDSAGNG